MLIGFTMRSPRKSPTAAARLNKTPGEVIRVYKIIKSISLP